MRKLLIAGLMVVGVAVVGVVAWIAFTRTPERSACLHVADLCGIRGGSADHLQTCLDGFDRLRKSAGDDAADRGLTCVERAKSCGEAAGCVAGTGLTGLANSVRDLQGVQRIGEMILRP